MLQYRIGCFFLLLLLSSYSNGQNCIGEPGEIHWNIWNNLPDGNIEELKTHEFFPNKPDQIIILNQTKTLNNYNDDFGGMIRGFIKYPTTEQITFNVTGDHFVKLYLSTNTSSDNLSMIAYSPGRTSSEEHDKYPEQTSNPILIQANNYYYFELFQTDRTAQDHATIWWKTSETGLNNWSIISSNYIYNYSCESQVCPPRETPCNDGNSATTEDMEDGHCNCIGRINSENYCIGNRGLIEGYLYENIPGIKLENLYEHPNYPLIPDKILRHSFLGTEVTSIYNSMGLTVSAFLTVPTNGQYKFNVTSDNRASFFLSSDDQPENIATNIYTDGSTETAEHNKYPTQTSNWIYLQKNKYYYFELHLKESSGNEHFGVFWKNQDQEVDQWKRIPAFYIYDYQCEASCIPENTPCDDGNLYTNNDKFDDNCNCIGTPCIMEDCNNELVNYTPFQDCGLSTEIDNINETQWLSCNRSIPPGTSLNKRHWIKYDLQEEYRIWDTHIWNYNASNETDHGIKFVRIDYSLDGQNWVKLGQYNWSLATGDTNYAGFIGPNFEGAKARYILISTTNNFEGCAGLSKVTFKTRKCENEGTICDDGNPNTYNDVFDHDCNCSGNYLDQSNCTVDSLFLQDTILRFSKYAAIKFINSQNKIINSKDIKITAGESIELDPGFNVELGGMVQISIDECEPVSQVVSTETISKLKNFAIQNRLVIHKNEIEKMFTIGYYVHKPSDVKLVLRNSKNTEIILCNHYFSNSGYYTKKVYFKDFDYSKNSVQLTIENESIEKEFTPDNFQL